MLDSERKSRTLVGDIPTGGHRASRFRATSPEDRDQRNRWKFGQAALEVADRFRSKVDSSGGPEVCWPWTGALSLRGYGQWHPWKGVHVPAHRFALILKLGRDLEVDEVAMHLCHNRPCCNDAHLVPGSQSDNMQHSARDGRAFVGDLNPMARLTTEDVMSLRRRARVEWKRGWLTREAAKFNYPVGEFGRVIRGYYWKHLPEAFDYPRNAPPRTAQRYLRRLDRQAVSQ